jgi:hypothetical protein
MRKSFLVALLSVVLDLGSTGVTQAGIARLQRALPGCRVHQ